MKNTSVENDNEQMIAEAIKIREQIYKSFDGIDSAVVALGCAYTIGDIMAMNKFANRDFSPKKMISLFTKVMDEHYKDILQQKLEGKFQ